MRKLILTLTALAGAAAFSASAEAKTYSREIAEGNEKTYCVQYVPSTYEYDTRGKKVYGESTSWVGDIVDGGTVVKRRNPAVYIQTRKLVEQDHYTLTDC